MTFLECDFVFGWLGNGLSWTGSSDEGTGEAHRGARRLHGASPAKAAPHFNMQHLCRESRPKWLLLRGRRLNLLKLGVGTFGAAEVLHRC